jgi:hypothetical protein
MATDKKRPPTKKKSSGPIGKVKQGALRKSLGLSTSKDMPEKDKQVKPGDSALTKKRKIFAQNAKKWNHKGK